MRRVGPGVVLYSDNEWGFGVEAQRDVWRRVNLASSLPITAGNFYRVWVDSLQAVATNGAGVQSMEILSFVYSWNMAFLQLT